MTTSILQRASLIELDRFGHNVIKSRTILYIVFSLALFFVESSRIFTPLNAVKPSPAFLRWYAGGRPYKLKSTRQLGDAHAARCGRGCCCCCSCSTAEPQTAPAAAEMDCGRASGGLVNEWRVGLTAGQTLAPYSVDWKQRNRGRAA